MKIYLKYLIKLFNNYVYKKTISNKNDVKKDSIFQLLLFKPWEYAKKSQKFIHYYIVVDQIEIYFQDDSCGDYYLLIPTTTKYLEGNKSLLKIDYYDWFGNKDVYLKLDEIFIIEKVFKLTVLLSKKIKFQLCL